MLSAAAAASVARRRKKQPRRSSSTKTTTASLSTTILGASKRLIRPRKWLKTPHNRFKMISLGHHRHKMDQEERRKEAQTEQSIGKKLPASRSQQVVKRRARRRRRENHLNCSCKSFLLLAGLLALYQSLPLQQQVVVEAAPHSASQVPLQAQTNNNNNNSGLATAIRTSRNSSSSPPPTGGGGPTNHINNNSLAAFVRPEAVKLSLGASRQEMGAKEEEVSLVGPGESTEAVIARVWRRQRHQQRPHLIKIQATLNGKLVAPARLINGTHRAHDDEQADPNDWRPIAIAAAAGATITTRPPTPGTSPSPTPASTVADGDEPECPQDVAPHASVAASSQTLRLTSSAGLKPAGNRTQLLQPEPLDSTAVAAAATMVGLSMAPASGTRKELAASTASKPASVPAQQQQQVAAKSSGHDSILSLIDDYDSKIITNRTRAQLSCDSGEMVLRLNFSDSFKGIVYPDHNRLSPCRFFGDGHHNYELRLPLRGCGTRQAAPRVFVNDVIVRFHKTLELEEDEVKTLICRYPPPLASDPTLPEPGLTLNPAVIGQSRQPSPSQNGENNVLEQEGPAQFEFVDSLGGRPRLPEPGSSGNIETLSENLIVAPASGSQQQPADNHDPTGGYGQAPSSRAGLRHREQPTDLLNSRNSLLLEPPVGGGSGGLLSGQHQANSLSFFERFSSVELLFLISSLMFLILLIMGLATSYYCFRRQAHRGSVQRASAILRRKRRYVGPGALLHDPSSGPARSAPSQAALQQYYSQRMSSHHRRPSLTAPSSPESDLSARGLLAPGTHMSSYRSHHYHPSYNQAFVPDNGLAKHYAATTYLPTAATAAAYNIDPQQLQTAGRRQHRSMQQVSNNGTGPVLGRRETIYSRPQRFLSPPASGATRIRNPPAQFSSSFGQNQLKPNNLNLLDPTMVNQAFQNRLIMENLNQPTVVDYDHMPGAGHLSRAKSLSSVRYLEPLVGNTLPHPDQFLGGTEAVRGRRRRQRVPEGMEFLAGRRSALRRPVGTNLNATKEYSSDSELEQNNNINNNNINTSYQANKATQKPSILVKSIEDSYITNFTEIYEQEYVKKDSTRPLSMSQWRSMQPKVQRKPPGNNRGGDNSSDELNPNSERQDTTGSEVGGSGQEEDTETIKGSQEDDGEQRYHSQHANLRSLTELDVNFARSLLVPPQSTSSLRPAASADQLNVKTTTTNLNSADEPATSSSDVDAGSDVAVSGPPKMRSSSAPEVAEMDQRVSFQTPNSTPAQNQSPDLILSPDYEHNRLELKSQNQISTSSHNSVSYV